MRYINAKIEDHDPKIKALIEKNLVKTTDYYGQEKVSLKKGILFYGKTGCGKTHAMYSIKNKLSGMSDVSNIKTWQEFLFNMKLYYADNKNNKNELALLMDNKVLFIDDLGVETDTAHALEMFYMIVNNAYVNEKALFISTNLTFPEINTKYGERISSRLLEMCELYQMDGENRRLN